MFLRCAATAAFRLPAFAQQIDIDNAFSEYQRAWTNADKNGASRLASDDLVWITRGGRALNKQQLIEVFNPAGGTRNIREKKVRVFGDVAVVTYAGDEGSSAVRRTIVWHKTSDGWKMISVQATAMQEWPLSGEAPTGSCLGRTWRFRDVSGSSSRRRKFEAVQRGEPKFSKGCAPMPRSSPLAN